MNISELLARPLRVANVGVADFTRPLEALGIPVTSVDWRPPALGDEAAGWKLAHLIADPRIEAANRETVERILAVQPVWTDVRPAGEVLPELAGERLLLHAGPPVEWERMCGPMRAAVIGATLLEGWAETPAEASRLASEGGITFDPCHHHNAVGPMAGVISASMPLIVAEDERTGQRAFSNLNEGQGRCLRYGALGDDVMDRLRWMSQRLGPSLAAALRARPDPLHLKVIIAQALQMGDECHSRNVAASAQLTRLLSPALARHADLGGIEALEFLAANNYWFLNFSMVTAKLATMAGHGIPGSTVVTTLARNGVDFGIRVSGCGDKWFTAPVPVPDGLYFPGYGPEDANPDIGDSAIAETYGLGGFALAAAPAIVGFVGGTPGEARQTSEQMAHITAGRHHELQLPALDFLGTPLGIDCRAVLDTGIEPTITTGISHREPGIGQIGAGITHAPMACFTEAIRAFEHPEAAAIPA